MKSSHKALIITSLSFSLHAMEQKSLIQNNDHFYKIDHLYKTAYTTLDSYNPATTASAHNIINILTKTKELKSSNIEPKHIGQFAYQQPIKSIFFSAEKPPYNNPLYVSVLFDRIERYNTLLEKSQFSSPTVEQFALHTKNKKTEAVLKKAETFRVLLDAEQFITHIQLVIATYDFDILLKDIATMQQLTPDEITILADKLYGKKL